VSFKTVFFATRDSRPFFLQKESRLKAAFLLCFLLVCGVAEAAYPVPEIKKDCSICHISHMMAEAGLRKPLSALCLDCHPEKGGEKSDHVIGITPRPDMMPGAEAKGLVLSEGRITCATCHDPHGSGYVKMLRAGPKELCQACHRK
jgi:predicted CXXCH cytochrome family protein